MPSGSGGGGGGGPVVSPVTLTAHDATETPLTLIGADGQTGTIFETDDGQGVAGTATVKIAGGIGASIRNVGAWDAGGGPYLEVRDSSAAPVAGNWVFQARGDTSYVLVKNPGHLYLNAHAAPADALIAAGEVALWFDQTDGVGNTKVMFKGKSADGTIKTAAIVLA